MRPEGRWAVATKQDERLSTRLTELAVPLIDAAELELVELEVRGSHGSRVVEVIVDADDGVDVGALAQLSRDLGAVLDREDPIDGKYTLRVSSPGVDRPLRRPRDFERNLGRPVRVVRRQPTDLPGEVTGTVVAVDGGTLTLDVEGEPLEVEFTDVDHGRIQLPW